MERTYTTPQLLEVAGVSSPAFKQWCKNRRLSLSGADSPGTGNHRRHGFSDVLQCAVANELSRLGIPPVRAQLIWLYHLSPNLHRPDLAVFMAPELPPGRDLLTRVVPDGEDPGFDLPDAPVAYAVLRFRPIYDRVQAKLAELRA